MSYSSARWIFILGTALSAILFLALTYDTHRQVKVLTHADRLSDKVIAGKKVFEKYNCNDCHTILGFGGYYAPDLTKVFQRKGEPYIRRVIEYPEKILAQSFRKMPQQQVQPEEIDRLLDFFAWVSEIDNQDWPPQDSKTRHPRAVDRLLKGVNMSMGAAVFKESACFDCHQLQGVGGTTGPQLDGLGARMTVEEIKLLLRNPQAKNPAAVMPEFSSITDTDIQALAEFLVKQQGGRQ